MHPYVHCIIYNSQGMEAAQVSIDRWMNKDVVYMYNRILLSCKKEWDLTICDNMNGPRRYYGKWNKSNRKTNTIWFHLYVESKNQTKTNKTKQNTESQI